MSNDLRKNNQHALLEHHQNIAADLESVTPGSVYVSLACMK